MATSRFVQISYKEIDEIKINSILKTRKTHLNKICSKNFQGIYFIFSIIVFYNVNNMLGLQIISRKNITLVYKDGQLFLIFT